VSLWDCVDATSVKIELKLSKRERVRSKAEDLEICWMEGKADGPAALFLPAGGCGWISVSVCVFSYVCVYMGHRVTPARSLF